MDLKERFEKETGYIMEDDPFSSGPMKCFQPDGEKCGYYDYAHRRIKWVESKLKDAEKENKVFKNALLKIYNLRMHSISIHYMECVKMAEKALGDYDINDLLKKLAEGE